VFIASVAKLRGIDVCNGEGVEGDRDGDADGEDGFLKGVMWG